MERIQDYLSGRTLLISGATGFLGQPLVEKILWAMPDIERIYVLIRPKRRFGGAVQQPEERLRRQLFQSSVFDRLRFRHGDQMDSFLASKLVAVAGDLSEDGLGIDDETTARLRAEVDVVINSAAVVSFDARLDDAIEINTLGAARVVDFAASCDHAILIHVSTAYVCGSTNEAVPEIIHHTAPPGTTEPFPPRQFTDPERDLARIRAEIDRARLESESPEVKRELVQALLQRARNRRGGKHIPRREIIENLRRRWLENRLVERGMRLARERGWNDTYTYTKALGEQMVLRRADRLPLAIVRPAIIESSLGEPSPGWLDGLRMADPLIVAIGKGRLRELPLDPDVVLDLVPADMVVNAILAAIPKVAADGGPRIYQVATGSRNPIALGPLHDLIVEYFQSNPMLDKTGQPIPVRPVRFPKPRTFRVFYRLRKFPLDIVERELQRLLDRGVLASRAQRLKRKVSATRAALDKLHYFGELYEPYLNLDCRFLVDETMTLFHELDEEEQRRFNFDFDRLNWRHYIHVHIAGVKKHILKVERAGTLEVDDDAAAHRAAVSTINDVLERSAERHPDRVALQIRRDGTWEQLTYGQTFDAAKHGADRLHRLGLTKGDRVVLFSENQPEWGVSYFSAARLGVVVVPLDPQTWAREVWSTARFTGARAILASRACFARFSDESLAENEAAERPLLLLDVDNELAGFDVESYPRSTRPHVLDAGDPSLPELEPVESDDPTSIIFTTSTASDPRGAIHTHRSFLSNLFGVHRSLSTREDDRFLSVLPLYHALEFTCGFLMPIYRGAEVTYARSLKPKALLEMMRETGTTIMLGVPTLYALIRDDLERRVLRTSKSPIRSGVMATSKQISRSWERAFRKNIGRQLFSRVHQELGGRIRLFVSGGSRLGEELYENYRDLGITIYEGYGLTETAPVLTVNPLYQSREGSAGRPLPGVELQLYHTNRDGVGEIVVRSPSLMQGYYHNPAATERVMVDGWFHTGDLGWVDTDGYLYITGRIKDVIVTGAGKNVYPIDLEAIYSTLSGIDDICVMGVKSGLTEEVHAFVVPAEQPSGEDPEDVRPAIQREIQALARELPSYHRLQHVHLWPAPLPRNEDGSLDRGAIRRHLAELLRGRRERGGDGMPAPLPADADRKAALITELSRLSHVPADEIDPGSHLFDDLGLDSLLAIELLLILEHRFGVSLDDDTAGRLRTVGDILRELRALPAAGSESRPPAARATRSILPVSERSAVDRALFDAFRASMRGLYGTWFDLEVHGVDHVPTDPPYILAANHASHLDTPAVITGLERAAGRDAARRLHVLAARDYFFDTAVKTWLSTKIVNMVPIEREETSLAGLRMVESILENGQSVLIFPEGTRSRNGALQEFRPGLGLMAWELGVPIVPVCVEGTFAALPVGRIVPRAGDLRVTFGEPITIEPYQRDLEDLPRDEVYRRIAGDVRTAILDLASLPPGGDGSG